MSHFYGMVSKSSRKTKATACGTKNTGMEVVAASWDGAVKTEMWYDETTGKNMYRVTMMPWKDAASSASDGVVLSEGEVSV